MKAAKIILVVLGIAALINFIRAGAHFSLPRVLPFAGGFPPSFYDVAAIALILLLFWGLARLQRRKDGSNTDE